MMGSFSQLGGTGASNFKRSSLMSWEQVPDPGKVLDLALIWVYERRSSGLCTHWPLTPWPHTGRQSPFSSLLLSSVPPSYFSLGFSLLQFLGHSRLALELSLSLVRGIYSHVEWMCCCCFPGARLRGCLGCHQCHPIQHKSYSFTSGAPPGLGFWPNWNLLIAQALEIF